LAPSFAQQQQTSRVTGKVPRNERIGVLRFILDTEGLEPPSVQIQEGYYQLLVLNGLLQKELEISLDDSQDRKVAEEKAPSRGFRAGMVVYLSSGKHVLKVRGRSNWRAEIVVIKR
jgi:hypothetical protein